MPQDDKPVVLSPEITKVPDLNVTLKDSKVTVEDLKSKEAFIATLALQIFIQNISFIDYGEQLSHQQIAAKSWQAAAAFTDYAFKKYSTYIKTLLEKTQPSGMGMSIK